MSKRGEIGGGCRCREAGREVPEGLVTDEEDLQEDDESGCGVERDGLGYPQHDGHEEHPEHAMARFGQALEVQEPRQNEGDEAEGKADGPPLRERALS